MSLEREPGVAEPIAVQVCDNSPYVVDPQLDADPSQVITGQTQPVGGPSSAGGVESFIGLTFEWRHQAVSDQFTDQLRRTGLRQPGGTGEVASRAARVLPDISEEQPEIVRAHVRLVDRSRACGCRRHGLGIRNRNHHLAAA
jgi:hypothetical protein